MVKQFGIVFFVANKKSKSNLSNSLLMGQVIDFDKKGFEKGKEKLCDSGIIKLLPKLRVLKGETIVIYICQEILSNEDLLNDVLREIAILKCMEINVLVVLDVNKQVDVFCSEILNLDKQFVDVNYVQITDQTEVIDAVFKRELTRKVVNNFKAFNIMSLGVSGYELGIVLPDEVVNKKQSVLTLSKYDICYETNEEKAKKQYSTGMLEELLKTNIIPVITPTFNDRNGNTYVIESSIFGAYLSGFLSSLKYVELYVNQPNIPTRCLYGIERFTKIVKSGSFTDNDLRVMNSGIESIKNGVQGAHIINVKQVSLLEEFCGSTICGLFLYDDTLNQF